MTDHDTQTAFLPQTTNEKAIRYGLDIPRCSGVFDTPNPEWLLGRFKNAMESVAVGGAIPEKDLAEMLLRLTYNVRGAVAHDVYAALLTISANLHVWCAFKQEAAALIQKGMEQRASVPAEPPSTPVKH